MWAIRAEGDVGHLRELCESRPAGVGEGGAGAPGVQFRCLQWMMAVGHLALVIETSIAHVSRAI